MRRSYAVLLLPSANRVYAAASPELAAAELTAMAGALDTGIAEVAVVTVAGVPYVQFEASTPLTARDLSTVADLSTAYALFEREASGALRPVEVVPTAQYDDDLITIQRYSGKTNEQFTHLLVNLALAASPMARERRAAGQTVRLLDPLAGRGTVLNRGLMYGFDVYGIEIDRRATDAYVTFLTTYLRDKRVPFGEEASNLRRGRQVAAHRTRLVIRRKGRAEQVADVVHDETHHATEHFAKASFDLLVADLPYGVRHGSRGGGRTERSPLGLVQSAVPVWEAVLRKGAGVALAFNCRTARRGELEAALEEGGLEVVPPPEGRSFEHRVDRAITRDVVVVRKPQQNRSHV